MNDSLKTALKASLKTSLAILAIACGNTATAAEYPGLEKYVYPDNRPQPAPDLAWLPDGSAYALLSADGKRIVTYDPKTGAETGVLFDASHTRESTVNEVESFTISPEGSRILLCTGSEYVYRRSSRGTYYVYEVRSRILRPLSLKHPVQQEPLFSPDGRMVAFVDSCNVHIAKVDYNTEVAVTRDGAPGEIINGVPDWTYEEEFDTTLSMAWSPDSRTLSFLRYDESKVPSYSLPIYGVCDAPSAYSLYPGTLTYKYPVAGEQNSSVTLRSYDVDNRKTLDIKLPAGGAVEYVPRIMYAPGNPELLLAVTLNRDQNRMEIFSVNPRSTVVKSLLVEQNTSAWLSPLTYEDITLTQTSLLLHSSRSGWNHLYEYSYSGSLMRQVTSGEYDVTACYGIDEKSRAVYFQSTATGPVNRVVSRIDAKGKLTHLSAAKGCASAIFAPGMLYYTLTESSSAQPPVTMLRRTDSEKGGRTLVDNRGWGATYAAAPRREFITLPSAKAGIELNCMIVRPDGYDTSRSYPLIVNQYSGPGSQEVLDRWSADWTLYFASRGYVVATIDPRGTGGRGRAFMDADYRRLGSASTADLIAATRALTAMGGIDPAKVAIYGWSFGGYQALMCATEPGSPFSATVAIAPVTDWRLYDTAYTERYMLTPGQNALGYRESAPLARVNNLQGKLLLMWGTLDDNVHPANSLEFLARLQAAGRYAEAQPFVNQNHSIHRCGTRRSVYAYMLDFLDRSL